MFLRLGPNGYRRIRLFCILEHRTLPNQPCSMQLQDPCNGLPLHALGQISDGDDSFKRNDEWQHMSHIVISHGLSTAKSIKRSSLTTASFATSPSSLTTSCLTRRR